MCVRCSLIYLEIVDKDTFQLETMFVYIWYHLGLDYGHHQLSSHYLV